MWFNDFGWNKFMACENSFIMIPVCTSIWNCWVVFYRPLRFIVKCCVLFLWTELCYFELFYTDLWSVSCDVFSCADFCCFVLYFVVLCCFVVFCWIFFIHLLFNHYFTYSIHIIILFLKSQRPNFGKNWLFGVTTWHHYFDSLNVNPAAFQIAFTHM